MGVKTVGCRIDSFGVLIPDDRNPIISAIIESTETDEGKLGRILIGNRVIAFLEYDYLNKRVIGFTCTDMSPTGHITETSIRNILNTL